MCAGGFINTYQSGSPGSLGRFSGSGNISQFRDLQNLLVPLKRSGALATYLAQ